MDILPKNRVPYLPAPLALSKSLLASLFSYAPRCLTLAAQFAKEVKSFERDPSGSFTEGVWIPQEEECCPRCLRLIAHPPKNCYQILDHCRGSAHNVWIWAKFHRTEITAEIEDRLRLEPTSAQWAKFYSVVFPSLSLHPKPFQVWL